MSSEMNSYLSSASARECGQTTNGARILSANRIGREVVSWNILGGFRTGEYFDDAAGVGVLLPVGYWRRAGPCAGEGKKADSRRM